MADITSANAVYMLTIDIFPAPQQLQGFAADDIFDTDPIESVETLMGVDGFLSAGFVFVPVRQQIHLQADSPSGSLFDAWWAANQVGRQSLFATGVVTLTALGTKWALFNGVLRSYQPIPNARRVLQPRVFGITWESVSPAVA